MLQIIEKSHEEKVKMYMKLPKKELIEMLIKANKTLSNRPLIITYPPQPTDIKFDINNPTF